MTDPPELAVPDVLEPGTRLVLRSIHLFPTRPLTSHLPLEEREFEAGGLNQRLEFTVVPPATKQNELLPCPTHVTGRRGASLNELEALYRSRFDVFTRVATSVTGDSDRARDAVQEAFTRAVRGRRSFRRECPLESWVWPIVLNAARSAAPKASPTVDEDQLATTNGHPEHDVELRVALARLPERQRTAVFLRYYADLEYAAIGEVLGIQTGTVSATLNAAHAALRSQLEEVRT